MRYHTPLSPAGITVEHYVLFSLHVCNIFVMYEKIIFNKIEYVKLFPIFHALMAVFVSYPHAIHIYSTFNPHRISELSTYMYSALPKKTGR